MKRLPPLPVVSGGNRFEVLRLVCDGVSSPYRVARLLKRDKKTVLYHLGKLSDAGLVKKDVCSWRVTNAGRAFLLEKSGQKSEQSLPSPISTASTARVSRRSSTGNEKGEENAKVDSVKVGVTEAHNMPWSAVRYHKVWVELARGVEVQRLRLPEKRSVMKSGAWFVDVRVADGLVRVWNNGKVLAKPKPFWGKSYEECEGQLKEWLVGWAVMVQDVLGFKFLQGGMTWSVLSGEVAYVNEFTAQKAHARKFRIKVFDDAGRLRIVSDLSLGDPELECVDPKKFRMDAMEVKFWWKTVVDGTARQIVENVPRLFAEHVQLGSLLAQQNETLKQSMIQQQLVIQEVRSLGGFGGRRDV